MNYAQPQQTAEDAFFGNGGGSGAPSFEWAGVGSAIQGVVVETKVQDQTKFGSNPPEPILDLKRPNPMLPGGYEVKKQLLIVLETALRGWQGVKPTNIPKEPNGAPKHPSEDDGKRAIYVKGWMTGAVGDAVAGATGKPGAPKAGGKLAVRCSELIETEKGNPYRKYEARYEAPTPGQGEMDWAANQPQAPVQQAPVQQAPQQPPAQQGWAQQAPPLQQPQAPAQPPAQAPADPWATPAQSAPAQDPWASAPPY